ncbi:MAG: imidazoleglycerol-phosphate dehydratase HisB [Clostridia bacterium]|jgi:imidazoleglycerol-phosphate dehydratase|nr:imidazoleglycerol-phosphate dehydratase HisB [Clostridia bacterium]
MRTGQKERRTKETQISVKMNLDGTGKYSVNTGIGFFDHMLELFSSHSGMDLELTVKGDLNVDAHHSVEDTGIVIGKLLHELLGDKNGIARYATSYIPMDETLARTVIDVSGRPCFVFNCDGLKGKIGEFDAELVEEFFRAVSSYGMLTIHTEVLYGNNLHHIAEAVFKSFAHALHDAVAIVGNSVPSSKGVLE